MDSTCRTWPCSSMTLRPVRQSQIRPVGTTRHSTARTAWDGAQGWEQRTAWHSEDSKGQHPPNNTRQRGMMPRTLLYVRKYTTPPQDL
jgi:hypothetical protein